jgi:hypothetical protein
MLMHNTLQGNGFVVFVMLKHSLHVPVAPSLAVNIPELDLRGEPRYSIAPRILLSGHHSEAI